MKKILGVGIATLALLGAGAGVSNAANDNSAAAGNKVNCFVQGDATCTVQGRTAKATVQEGSGALVYINNDVLSGKLVSAASVIRFSYSGDVTGGSPRFTFETTDGRFVSVEWNTCTDPATPGIVDVINDPTCIVHFNAGDSYNSWAEFVAANPNLRFATADQNQPFVLVERGTVTISKVQIK